MKCDYCGLESNTLTYVRIKGRYMDTKKCVACIANDDIAIQIDTYIYHTYDIIRMKTVVWDDDKYFKRLQKKYPKMTKYGYNDSGYFVFVGEEIIAFVGIGCL